MQNCYSSKSYRPTGHDGSLSTGHANSTNDMLSRLETMVLMGIELPLRAIQKQIASGLDIVIHLGRLRDKTRKVLEITEVLGFVDGEILLKPLFQFEETGVNEEKIEGEWRQLNDITHKEKLLAAGYEKN